MSRIREIEVIDSVLPDGASTSAKQDILLTELQLKADLTETQPVSAASLPLPSGASTSAKQDTLLAELQLKADLTETQPTSLESVASDAFQDVDVQYPIPTDGDSIYVKDIDVANSDNGGFSGVVTDYFDDLKTVNNDASATNPKIIKIWFNRSIQTHQIGFGCDNLLKTFSNIVIKALGSGEEIRYTKDLSADSTKRNSYLVPLTPLALNGVIIEFHTADEIGLSNIIIYKSIDVNARVQGIRDDGELGDMPLSNSNRLKTVSQPYGHAVSKGDITGHTITSRSGERVSITTTPSDISQLTATTIPIPPDAGSLISVVSTSTSDTLTTGTGVRSIRIDYIDPAGDAQTTDVSMNGTTIVNTGILMRYINSVQTITTGSTYAAVGTITIYLTGTPATIYRQISPLENSDLSCDYMVPDGHTFYITSWDASCAGTGKPVAFRLRGTLNRKDGLLTPRIFHTIKGAYLETSGTYFQLTMPIKTPGLCIVKITTVASQNGPYVSGGFEGWLENSG